MAIRDANTNVARTTQGQLLVRGVAFEGNVVVGNRNVIGAVLAYSTNCTPE